MLSSHAKAIQLSCMYVYTIVIHMVWGWKCVQSVLVILYSGYFSGWGEVGANFFLGGGGRLVFLNQITGSNLDRVEAKNKCV